MPISIVCSHCEKNLTMSDAAAGKQIRCPACKGVLTVPEAAAVEAPSKKKPAPAEEDDGDGGYAMDEKRDEEDEELKRKQKRERKRRDREERERRRNPGKPHRGVTVLVLGILSIILSIAFPVSWFLAWRAISMATEDLDAMAGKRMDPAGRGMTQAGKACAMIGAFLAFLGLVVAIGSGINSIGSK
jgi:phage FluMu protein Com